MWIRCILFLTWLAVCNATGKADDQLMRLPACAAKQGECDDNEGSVCGTDGQTYPTRCHLLRAQCGGHQVSLKYSGSCNACLEAVKFARRQQERDPDYFVPRCRKDGNFAAMQCYGNNGCWCSDSQGRPIEDATKQTRRKGKLRCRANRRGRRRLASHQISYTPDTSASKGSSEAGSTAHRACSKTDRLLFNANLMRMFRNEAQSFFRQPSLSDSHILEWKFSKLDTNGNKLLDRQEVRELKKVLRRNVKPRRCGRTFGKYCDVIKDSNLNWLEWSICFTKEFHNRSAVINLLASSAATAPPHSTHYNIHNTNVNGHHRGHTNTIASGGSPHTYSEDVSGSEEHEDNYEDSGTGYGGEEDDSQGADLPSSRTRIPSLYTQIFTVLNSKPEAASQDLENDSNCWMDQSVTLEEQGHGGKNVLFVPQCLPDGRYQRIQCYSSTSTSYCWCVNEDTGKSIPGTSVKNKRPQCDENVVVRPMKGCTEPRKTQFLKELKAYLNTSLLPSSTTGSNSTMWKTDDERIATLSFVYLDKNKNKSWDRREWKNFRDLVTSASNLRRCGKKMPRYCDVNGDKKISLAEWLNCLQATPRESATTPKPAQSNETASPKFQGVNPVERYLKD
ncbi:SPARC-related modular calcium-binding protein 2 isoform X1 [Drosophila biarmipes]|uniref:SPARC-related modular calcium-binding protein 2 isoform X1 n=1 Tax=Drosophila biarmipes TaxID=125945 RepID=UPI001CDB3F14|nr:SPARC-related modular calcium-binding protein 2 isoform X1 [Drosophila biarmipes]XP_043947860.1 SPARC-related modular calcium-binding protein 2 isoform X1 [Drosophila biarmipes]XP_050744109.1 SPARC-related modular calcium-binding protein 2 isoform X1 [Drosophila biarmipes]